MRFVYAKERCDGNDMNDDGDDDESQCICMKYREESRGDDEYEYELWSNGI